LAPELLEIFRDLEGLVVNSSSDYLQVSLTDMDIFLSEPDDMTETLRDWIGAMDTTLASQWAGTLGYVQATVGKDLGEIHFGHPDLIRAAIAGYV
jgi:carboxypeptidase C (cathepsin A)